MIAESDLKRVAAYLRKLLRCRTLWLSGGGSGQVVKVLIGDELVGTVDIDEDNDFVLTVPIMRDDLTSEN